MAQHSTAQHARLHSDTNPVLSHWNRNHGGAQLHSVHLKDLFAHNKTCFRQTIKADNTTKRNWNAFCAALDNFGWVLAAALSYRIQQGMCQLTQLQIIMDRFHSLPLTTMDCFWYLISRYYFIALEGTICSHFSSTFPMVSAMKCVLSVYMNWNGRPHINWICSTLFICVLDDRKKGSRLQA